MQIATARGALRTICSRTPSRFKQSMRREGVHQAAEQRGPLAGKRSLDEDATSDDAAREAVRPKESIEASLCALRGINY